MTTRMKKMRELAAKEAKNLRKYLTDDEKALLIASEIDPDNSQSCIYGKSTGSCFSARAHELIIKCAERVYKSSKNIYDRISESRLNGKPYPVVEGVDRVLEYFSPIETLIINDQSTIPPLVAYIKGETNKLVFPNKNTQQ